LGFLQPEDALFTCSVKQGIKARGSKMKMPMTTQKGEELTRGGNQGESQKRRFFLEREGEVEANRGGSIAINTYSRPSGYFPPDLLFHIRGREIITLAWRQQPHIE
jgi:hypothetical protein